ncbi:MAG: NHL repeat containing protein, partial [bacterium]
TASGATTWSVTPGAYLVLGQPDFGSSDANNGGLSASSLSFPRGAALAGTKFAMADSYNHRVLIWNSVPTSNHTSADVVLGQPDFMSFADNNGGVSGRSLFDPQSVASDGKRLFVYDNQNCRVLVWNSVPTSSDTSADVVLGQPTFSTDTPNNGGVSAASLSHSPGGLWSDGTRLFVTDAANHRVLIWNSIPATNHTSPIAATTAC